MTDEKDLIYAAGFFDGEGCIRIKKSREHYNMEVTITNTYFPVINWFKDIFGGYVYIGTPEKTNFVRKPVAKWGLTGRKAMAFLILIMPYLKQKKYEAEIAWEFQRLKSHKIGGLYGNTLKQKGYYEHIRQTRDNNVIDNSFLTNNKNGTRNTPQFCGQGTPPTGGIGG